MTQALRSMNDGPLKRPLKALRTLSQNLVTGNKRETRWTWVFVGRNKFTVG